MKWKAYPTFEEASQWKRWFAWHSVDIGNGYFAWLCFVEYRATDLLSFMCGRWEYREIKK